MNYLTFKHRVRQRLPNKIRFATVCRKCSKALTTQDLCLTCKIDQASKWPKPY